MIKLNVGASPIWSKEGWHTIDHKVKEGDRHLTGDAANIPLEKNSCRTIFNSHMIEHIPHTKLEDILLEFNRVLEIGGVLRILTPDLNKIARAYVNEDYYFFNEAKIEDESIRTDLGLGGMFVNFIVSPGQDTALFNRDLTEFISGYAHIYLYDFEMLEILLERCGFYSIWQPFFCKSELIEYWEPLHIKGLEPVWQNMNQEFYKKNNLIHYYDSDTGQYNINFELTGFDRDPITSLIIECKKQKTINKEKYISLNDSKENYNRYGQALLKNLHFKIKYETLRGIKIYDNIS